MLLTAIVFFPLVGALLVLLTGGGGDRPDREGMVRNVALAASLFLGVVLILGYYLWP